MNVFLIQYKLFLFQIEIFLFSQLLSIEKYEKIHISDCYLCSKIMINIYYWHIIMIILFIYRFDMFHEKINI